MSAPGAGPRLASKPPNRPKRSPNPKSLKISSKVKVRNPATSSGAKAPWPSRSYFARRSASLSTWKASLTSLNRSSAAWSPGFRSGWCFLARRLNARTISSCEASGFTPSTS